MLKKLLKYDLKSVFKNLVVFYGLTILFAVLTRIFFSFENSFLMGVIAQVSTGALIAFIINTLINMLMRNWVRFRNNFYGDESYLTHTLPVEKKSLYHSKGITAFISLLVSVLVIVLAIAIAFYSKENIELVQSFLFPMVKAYHSTVVRFLALVCVVMLLEFANILQAGYTGLLLGHRKNHGKMVFSVLLGFGVYFFIQIFTLLVMLLFACSSSELMNLFVTEEIVDLKMLKVLMYIGIGSYSFTAIVNYFVNVKLFQKGVNVD